MRNDPSKIQPNDPAQTDLNTTTASHKDDSTTGVSHTEGLNMFPQSTIETQKDT